MWVTSFGNGMKVGTMNTVGLNEVTFDKNDIMVYPNPINEILNFTNRSNNNSVIKINVYNLNGQLLISGQNENNSINTSSLTSGIYLAEFIFSDKSREFKKVVK